MIPYCNHHGVGLIPWGPLHAGDLARPFDATSVRKEERQSGPFARKATSADETITKRVEEIAKKRGWTMGQVSLAWINTKVSSPIVGVSSVSLFFTFLSLGNLIR